MKEHLEKDNYILCPICGKEKFNLEDYFIFCNHCGWEGNINSDENFVELNGYSVRDYRKVYQEYIKEHPGYIWKNDKDDLEDFMDSFVDFGSKCPCCNEESFDNEHSYCYKCGWKYNFVQAQFPNFDNSSNKLSLNQYKEQYNKIISNNPNYMWIDSNDVNILFNDKQKEWLKKNNIKLFNKLTSDEEMYQIIDSIHKIQKQYENKEGYEEYMFIKSIIDEILDII